MICGKLLFPLGSEGDWRRDYHWKYNGNLYPTHGLGPCRPVSWHRPRRSIQITSSPPVRPKELYSKYLRDVKPNGGRHAGEKYICGDMNTSIIKTELGRTIMIQHDVVSPRHYSRINALYGTGATFLDYPGASAIDNPKQYGLAPTAPTHGWTRGHAIMREKFTHPLWRKLRGGAPRGRPRRHGLRD